MALKNKLEQKLVQKLSPQQIQLIKLLELPILELEQRIKKELEENPVLEEGEPEEEITQHEQDPFLAELQDETDEQDQQSTEDNPSDEQSEEDLIAEYPEDFEKLKEEVDDEYIYNDDDEIPYYKLQVNNFPAEEKQIPFAASESFYEYMNKQIGFLDLTDKQRKIAEYIIGNLDNNGFLKKPLEYLVYELFTFQNIETTKEEVEYVLKQLQTLDPPGIAARNLQETLLIQLDRKLEENPNKKSLKIARKIISDYFNEFTKKHYEKIISKLSITKDQLREAINEIKKLNPKPRNAYSNEKVNPHQIIPDFILQKIDDKLILTLNSPKIPPIRISKSYEQLLKQSQDNNDKKTSSFLKQKIDSAKWFLEAIKQRENTLYKTMKAIIDYQKEFFETGDEKKLKPMILKDIADRTGLDISTISRVANSKYIQTPYGIFPLKHFFSEAMEKEDGETVSTKEIKKILRDLINNEDKSKPLTDEKLAQELQKRGYKIARRTVAKYREQMGIPVARLRKQL